MGTKEHGKMFKLVEILEDGRVPSKGSKFWKIDFKQRRITRRSEKRKSGASDGLRRLRSRSGVLSDACKEEGQQDFRDLHYERGK